MAVDTTDVTATRERLGRVGLFTSAWRSRPLPEELDALRRIERLGYGSIWNGEGIGGRDAFALAGAQLAATSTIVVGSGIANIWARHPATPPP